MQKQNIFDPEKIDLIDFQLIKVEIDIPENFDTNKVTGHQLDNSLQLAFNLDDKLAKADFTLSVRTESKGENKSEVTGSFHLRFIYRIENLEELATAEKNQALNLDPGLANALSSVTYSTSRGILLTRLQGTALHNFVLPIINPNKLLRNS